MSYSQMVDLLRKENKNEMNSKENNILSLIPKAEIILELLDKTQLKVIAYNEEADCTMQNIRKNDIVFIYGIIKETEVVVKNVHII